MTGARALRDLYARSRRLRRGLRQQGLAAVADDEAVFGALLGLRLALTSLQDNRSVVLLRQMTALGLEVVPVTLPKEVAGEQAPVLAGFDFVFGPGGEPVPGDVLGVLVGACRAMVRERRGEERRIGQLETMVGDLELEVEAAQIEAKRYARLATSLFGAPALTALPTPLARLFRAGPLARELLGGRPLDAIPPRLRSHVRRLFQLRAVDPGAAARVMACDAAELAAALERQERLGAWAARASRCLAQGGWRAALLRLAVRILGVR